LKALDRATAMALHKKQEALCLTWASGADCLLLLELGSSPLCVRMSFCREFSVCDAPGPAPIAEGAFCVSTKGIILSSVLALEMKRETLLRHILEAFDFEVMTNLFAQRAVLEKGHESYE
jgi:hypothetical protein